MGLVVSVNGFRRRTPRVLIVSAADMVVESVRSAVQEAGYSIGEVAPDVTAALNAMKRQNFDAVIVGDPDLQCSELAQSTLRRGIPIALFHSRRSARPRTTKRRDVTFH
jgi:DNA-binding response OmpR family regulator